jgi:hypothetical protein
VGGSQSERLHGLFKEHGFHARFEDEYINTHIELTDVLPHVAPAKVLTKPREDILAFLERSNSMVEQLYMLDKQEPFGEATKSAEHKAFAVDRLADGTSFRPGSLVDGLDDKRSGWT